MATIRKFSMFDILKYNNVNLDLLTETFYTNFYGRYLSQWPEYCVVYENNSSIIEGYIMGKVEGAKGNDEKKDWHGHVTAVTVAPDYRRKGLARSLMNYLEEVTEKQHDAYFVDLFVRSTNKVAIRFYEVLGYVIYRTVTGYYSGDSLNPSEDAYDMRKSMPKDVGKVTMQPTGKAIMPNELEFH